MKIVVFVRHAKSKSNASNTLSSDIEGYPLTEEGISQAEAMAIEISKISKVDKLYTSPIIRAAQTAEFIGKGLDLKPEPDTRLVERLMGSMNNKTFPSEDELRKQFRMEIESGYKNGLESWHSLQHRLSDFVASVNGSITIAVSHSDPIMAVMGCIDPKYDDHDWTTRIPYASITALDFENKRILCIGSNSLPDLLKKA